MNIRRAALVVVPLMALAAVWGASSFESTPNLTAPACQPDPSAQIAALPAGSVFHGVGCYLVPNGIRITQPITIDGGSYVDPSTAIPAKGGFQPVIDVYETHNVALVNLSVTGGNPSGAYKPNLVGQAGIKLTSAANVTITNVTTNATFGDGLELWAGTPKDKSPDTNVLVSGLTVNTAGRNGITPASVYGATLSRVTINSWGLTSVDFESDISGVGAGNVTFYDSSLGGVFLQEAFTGPVSFVDCTLSNHVVLIARHPVPYALTFSGGSLSVGTKSGTTAVDAKGPTNATFSGVAFMRTPTRNPGPLWSAANGAHLTFAHSSLAAPLGTSDASSTVTILP